MRAVTAVIRHQNFDQNTYNHDVALLRLRKPLVFGKTIAPICLPDDGLEPAGKIPFFLFGLEKIGGLFLFLLGKIGTVIGWGRIAEGGSLPGVVQHVQVPILTLNACRQMKYRASRITPNMVIQNASN
jgi:hypothetical protein